MPLDAAITQKNPDSPKLCREITYDTLRPNHSALSIPTSLVLRCCYSVGAFSDIKGSVKMFRQFFKLLDLFAGKPARTFL